MEAIRRSMDGRPPDPTRDTNGFTLVELLVVIAIIAALSGLITASLTAARRSAIKKNCRMEIDRIALALSTYMSDFGDYPPSDLERFYETIGNGINSGVECLLAHLCTQRKGGPYFEFKEDYLANADRDVLQDKDLLKELDWQFGDDQLREYNDPWGNPYVYIHNRDYDRTFTIFDDEGRKVVVRAGRSSASATYHGPTTFQLYSLGPNGKYENGEGDDIGSWD